MFKLFFSPRGRIPRWIFWLAPAALLLAFIVLFAGIEHLAGRGATLALYPPFYWSAFSLAAKRFHDRNKTAWWLLLLLLPVLGVAWVALELAFARGTAGENRHGPDPLAGRPDYQTNP